MSSLIFNPVAHLPTANPLTLLRMTGAMTTRNFALAEMPDVAAQVAVVTGGSAGIGREFCAQLLLHGAAKVYVLARSDSRFSEAKSEWSRKHGLSEDDLARRTEFIRCDLTDIAAVHQCAQALLKQLTRLDILILNGTYCFCFTCLHAVSTVLLMPLSRPVSLSRLSAFSSRRRSPVRRQPSWPFCSDQFAASCR